ncbi:unnamed protein product, partial [Brassica rapa]
DKKLKYPTVNITWFNPADGPDRKERKVLFLYPVVVFKEEK